MKPVAEKITKYIADSQRLFREIATLGGSHYQDIEVTGGWDLSKDVQVLIQVVSPKVVLLSVDDHFQKSRDLGSRITTRCTVAEVVALTSNTNDTQLLQAIKSGVVAYVDREVSADEVLADHAADVIWTVDLPSPNQINYISPSVTRLLGYSVVEAISKTLLEEMFTPESVQTIKHAYKEARLDPNKSWTLELTMIHKTGFLVPVEVKYSILLGLDGSPSEILAVARDINERKQVEDKLKKSEQELCLILDSLSEAVTVTDVDMNIVEVNQAAICLHDNSNREEIVGRSVFDIFAEKDCDKATNKIRVALEKGHVRDLEYTFMTENGSCFLAQLNIAGLLDSSGNPKGSVLISQDTTERKPAEEYHRSLQQELNVFSQLALAGD